jgi:RNA polymerase sigma-70 factor, ECF subfamily
VPQPKSDSITSELVTSVDKNPSPLLRMGQKQSQFEELFLTHLDGAYNLAFWLTGNDADAQVVIAKAYEQASKGFEKYREADVRTWLLRIVLRIAHGGTGNGNDQSKVVPLVPADNRAGSPESTVNTPATAEPGASHGQLGQNMSRALSRLPVELREILVLHEVEGWNYQQLAAALGTTRDIVTTRLSQARRGLRQGLGDARSN